MEWDLSGKVALVTGGGSGIGAAACLAFARAGAAVGVVDYRAEAADATTKAITDAGGRARSLTADVRDETQVAVAVAGTVAQFGGLHVVFANAGINGMQTPIEEMTLDEWRATLDTNLTGTFLVVKHAIPHLRDAGGGSIIVTASVNGTRLFAAPGYSAYSTSKGGQTVFARMAATECARWGIRVNTIMPGGVTTNIPDRTYTRNLDRIRYDVQYPQPYPPLAQKPATAEEIADLVCYLASDLSRNITGAEILTDGGYTLLHA